MSAALLVSCGSEARYAEADPFAFASDDALSAPAPEPSRSLAVPEQQFDAAGPTEDRSQSVVSESAADQATPAPARSRIYSADMTLVVGDIGLATQTATSIAERFGGYVETLSERTVVLRVAAAQFEQALAQLRDLGQVEQEQSTTVDVTDTLTDLSTRLELAEQTRARLATLLTRATDSEDRIAIVRELRRLDQEIESLRAQLRSLADLVALSRITVRLVARIERNTSFESRSPFAWIEELTPGEVSRRPAARRIGIELPPEFAVVSSGRGVLAEAADGSRIAVGDIVNRPRGDAEFWQQALVLHFINQFRDVVEISAGNWQGVALGDSTDSQYWVLVRPLRDRLLVLESVLDPALAGSLIETLEAQQ